MTKKTINEDQEALNERIAIMVDIMLNINPNWEFSDLYILLSNTKVIEEIKKGNYAYIYDSPQANLLDIAEELNKNNNPIGKLIIEENISRYFSTDKFH